MSRIGLGAWVMVLSSFLGGSGGRMILSLLMFPVLVHMYVRLARHEEKAVREEFGDTYICYVASGLLRKWWN